MAVSSNHHISRKDQTLFRKKDMFDPCLSGLEVMGEMVDFCKLAKDLTLLRRRNILGRGKVIGNENDPVPMKDLLDSDLIKSLDGKGCRDVIRKSDIDPDIDELSRSDHFSASMGGKNLFRDGHGILFLHIHPIQHKKG